MHVREHLQVRLQAARGLRLFEGRNEIGKCAVIDAPPALGRRDRQTDRQMRFADAGRPEEDDILMTLDEAELVQLSIRSRRKDGWKVKSKSWSCLTTGSRLDRIAACSRQLLRS
jgi:hypothetical protein